MGVIVPAAAEGVCQAGVELRYPPEWVPIYEELSPVAVPTLLGGIESLDSPAARRLSSTDREVAGRINGNWDVASIALASPLREVETLKAIRKLRRLGLIDLAELR